jgi:glycosyltransferase involved in cell wall biosynthesis
VRLRVVKISVIVPVYNPGSDIDDLLRTVVDQSLPAEEYEVIFVDDGSTDHTPARLDSLAAEHANVRVEHIDNSGWPGRPRNVGTDLAVGEYVYYVDNDDWLGAEALERLYATATADEADIVVGKVVGHGKFVPRPLFKANRSGMGIDWPPLLGLLSPHKLFRRAFLVEHGIRFPEGRRRLEDHVFVVHAYFHTERISVLADYPCYHWMLREVNASFNSFDPVGYFANMREVLDIVVEHTEPGELRDRLLSHWYRGKMLKRVGGAAFGRRQERDPAYNRALYEEIHRLALERYDAGVDAFLPFNLRLRSHLLRAGDFAGLEALAGFESSLRARADAYLVNRGRGVELRLDVTLDGAEQPLRFERRGERIAWVPPASLADRLPAELLELPDGLEATLVQVLLRAKADQVEFAQPTKVEPRLTTEGTVAFAVDSRIGPRRAAAGGPLPGDGVWEVLVNPIVAGFTATAPAHRRGAKPSLKLEVTERGTLRERKPPAPPPPPPTAAVKVKRRVKRALRPLTGRR